MCERLGAQVAPNKTSVAGHMVGISSPPAPHLRLSFATPVFRSPYHVCATFCNSGLASCGSVHTHMHTHTRTHTRTHTCTHTHSTSCYATPLQEFAKLHSFLTSVQSSFIYFDQDRSRTLEFNEVLQALKHAGMCVCVCKCAFTNQKLQALAAALVMRIDHTSCYHS